MKSKTIKIKCPGPPENMLWEDVEVSSPASGHVTLKH